jgi:hypothetical protein
MIHVDKIITCGHGAGMPFVAHQLLTGFSLRYRITRCAAMNGHKGYQCKYKAHDVFQPGQVNNND